MLSWLETMVASRRRLFMAGAVALGLGVAAYQLTRKLAAPALAAAGVVDDAVQQALRRGKPMVVEFGANACIACREMKPVLEALRRSHEDRLTVVDVDVIKQKQLGYISRYRIQLMPTQVFFDAQGRETSRHMGKIPAEEILARLGIGGPDGAGPGRSSP